MASKQEPLTLGIEEEYLLVNPRTRDLASDPPPGLMAACEKELGSLVCPEFLKSQIEIGTPVCANIKEAREQLVRCRSTVARVAEEHDLKLMAASTHPFADWGLQQTTDKERYHTLARDMQGAIRRMLICGMHVHVAIKDPDMRVDLMNQVRYFIPHLLALSTSSPFWQGMNMGVLSYRLTVFDGMPRTGIPDEFSSWTEYERLINRLVITGAIEDSSKIWWDIRPSSKFPTLEIRIADVCTRLEDALCIAAIYQCLLRMLMRLRQQNQRWRVYPSLLIQENRWRAQRYGVGGKLIDLGRTQLVPFAALIEDVLQLIEEDADALDCKREVEHARTIVARGTSAQRQLLTLNQACERGVPETRAFRQVVDMLLAETVADIPGYN